ncbi:MAG: tetratricopeptide repeat protein, partial [Candidatus Hodarchaeota archaeon]
PSCLPSGYQITKVILERSIPASERESVLQLMNPEREGLRNPGDFLRFEQLMEYLQDLYDPELHTLDGYASCRTPNFNHLFLAHMLQQGHPVVTTNFDNLIEYALLESKVPRNRVFPVIHRQDWETQPQRGNFYIYKLHGSIIDIRTDKDSRESLQATLTQISRDKGESFRLEPWKQKVFQSLNQSYDIIVLGYSGLDDFDVLPNLWSIPSSKRIIWITHDSNRSIDNIKIEMVQDNASFVPSNTDRIARNLLTFIQYQTRKPANLIRITVDTGSLLEWLWDLYLKKDKPSLKIDPCPDQSFILPDFDLPTPYQWYLTGQIFSDRQFPSKSLTAYQTALKAAQSTNNRRLIGACQNNIGLLLRAQGRIKEALSYYEQALEIDKELGDLRRQAIRFTNIGHILYSQGKTEEALNYFHQALKIDEQQKNLEGKASSLNNIAMILYNKGKVEEALKNFHQALKIDEQLGNLGEKIGRLSNIGKVYHDKG